MARYVKYEKVLDDINIITVQTKEYGSIEVIPVDTIIDIELADVQPVKRGEWGKRAYNRVQCSYCGKCEDIATDFCPNCGADMRGEDNG